MRGEVNALLAPGERQQLVAGVLESPGGLDGEGKLGLPIRIRLVRLEHLELREHARERRAQLMCGVVQELSLRLAALRDRLEQIVQTADHAIQLERYASPFHGSQIARRSSRDLLAHGIERFQRESHAGPHEREHHQQLHEVEPPRDRPQLFANLLSLVERLRHRHLGGARARLRAVRGEPHRHAAEQHRGVRRVRCRDAGSREIRVARDHGAIGRRDPEEHAIAQVAAQQRQRLGWHMGFDGALRVDFQIERQRDGRIGQRLVIRLLDGTFGGDEIADRADGQHARHGQDEERQQSPANRGAALRPWFHRAGIRAREPRGSPPRRRAWRAGARHRPRWRWA